MADTSLKKLDKWVIFPDSLDGSRFGGYNTRDDITEIKGSFPIGQNIKFTDGGKPTVRDGYEQVGSANAATTPITRAWKFERRDGVEIEMRAYDTVVDFIVDGVMIDFKILKGGFTANQIFTFDVISQTSIVNSEVFFCNGIEDWYKWTGVYGLFASLDNGANTLTLQGSTTLADLGYAATGAVTINGVEITYTGIGGQTFTGCSDMSAVIVAIGDVIVQTPTVVASMTNFKSSVAMAHDGRIHARLESKESVANFSKLDNPEDFTYTGLDGSGSAKEIEQGGPITAFAHDEQKIYIYKKRIIKTLEFQASGTRVDIPVWGTFKPTDDRSSTVGAISQKSTFSAPNGILFVTEDKEMLFQKREQFLDYPQQNSITDIIKPTFQTGAHEDGVGIVWKSKVWYAYKQDSKSQYNDTVIVYDLIRNRWFMPIVGWNVADWTIINNKLRWHSSTGPNTYELIDDKVDAGLPFTTILRTHCEDFGYSHYQKNVSEIMIEMYMTENAEVQFDILYDEDGYTETVTTVLRGTDTNNIINSQDYNVFGASPFGEEQFGSNANLSGMQKYRYIIPLKANNELYNMSLQWSTNLPGVNYELIRYGYHLEELIMKHHKKFIFNI